MGDAYVDVYATNNTTGEIKAKTLNFSAYQFSVANTVFYVSPAGGDVEVPVTTSVDYELTIDASWLAHAETKSVREETVVLTAAEANTSSTDNKATVTIKTGEIVLATFEVVQKNYYPEWIADEAGEPVEWAESFNLYKNAELTGDAEAKKGVFTFELTDDASKGAFKVKNLFYADLYFVNSQMVQSQGGEYYADVEGDVLTVYYAGATLSYGFTSDVQFTYDATAKAFSAETIATYSYSTYRNVWMADYAAAVKVDAPAGEGSPLDGEWNQTVIFGANSAVKTGAAATALVTVSGDQVTIENFILEGSTATGTLSGNTITVAKADSGLPTTYGPADADIVITLSEDNRTMTAANVSTGYGYGIVVESWTAESTAPAGGEEPEAPSVNIAGTWNQTVVGMSWPSPSATMTITVDGSTVTLTDFVAAGTVVTATFENNQIVIPAGTNIGSGSNTAGPLDADVVLTLEGNTFTAAPFSIAGWVKVSSYSATNPDMEVGGGEEPAEPAAFAELVWSSAVPFGGGQDRNMTMDSEYVYVAQAAGGNGVIKAYSIADGSYVKDVKVATKVSVSTNGTHAISCVRMMPNTDTSINGGKDVLVASNLTTGDGTAKLTIYVWANGIDADPNYYVIDSGVRRLGDKFTTRGTIQGGELLFFDYGDGNSVIRVNMKDGVAGLWGTPDLAYATGRYSMPMDGMNNIGECTIHPKATFDGDGNPTAALLTTNVAGKFFKQTSGNAYELSAWGVDPDLGQTFGYNFFSHNDKDYIAYVKLAADRSSATLNVIEDVNGAADFKGTLEAKTGLFTAPLEGTGNAGHGVADCATAVAGDVRYIAVMAQNIGLSVYKLN